MTTYLGNALKRQHVKPREGAEKCTYEDREGRCDANDGEPCAACVERNAAEFAYWKVECRTVTLAEGNPTAYRQNLIDAGRCHLVRE